MQHLLLSRLQSGIHRRIIARSIKKIVVVFNIVVEIPFYNREELVWYATPGVWNL
jgi:hypothetical protein